MIAEIGQPVTGSALWIAASLALLMVVAVAVIIVSEYRANRTSTTTLGVPSDTALPAADIATARRTDFGRQPATSSPAHRRASSGPMNVP